MRAKAFVTIPLEAFKDGLLITGLSERQRREYAGFVASLLGSGGVALAARALGMSPETVQKGLEEFTALSEKADAEFENAARAEPDASPRALPAGDRIRRPGGGRRSAVQKYPGLRKELELLLSHCQENDPTRRIQPLLWTTLSLRKLHEHFAACGFELSHTVVGEMLDDMGFEKHGNRRMPAALGPLSSADEQFHVIKNKASGFRGRCEPVVVLDCGETGKLADPGECRPAEDLPASPFGARVIDGSTAFVNLMSPGSGAGAALIAAESLGRWLHAVGRVSFLSNRWFPARSLYVVVSGVGETEADLRLWKHALAQIAERTGLEIHVSHLPPGTLRWYQVQHRFLCCSPGDPENDLPAKVEAVVRLITQPPGTGGEITVDRLADPSEYDRDATVPDEVFRTIDTEPGHMGGWNYVIRGFV